MQFGLIVILSAVVLATAVFCHAQQNENSIMGQWWQQQLLPHRELQQQP